MPGPRRAEQGKAVVGSLPVFWRVVLGHRHRTPPSCTPRPPSGLGPYLGGGGSLRTSGGHHGPRTVTGGGRNRHEVAWCVQGRTPNSTRSPCRASMGMLQSKVDLARSSPDYSHVILYLGVLYRHAGIGCPLQSRCQERQNHSGTSSTIAYMQALNRIYAPAMIITNAHGVSLRSSCTFSVFKSILGAP